MGAGADTLVTGSRDSLRELQTSGRQLIREVEELETKVDGRLAEVRSQLARLEVAQAGLRTSVANVIDEQRQLPALTQKVGPGKWYWAGSQSRENFSRGKPTSRELNKVHVKLDKKRTKPMSNNSCQNVTKHNGILFTVIRHLYLNYPTIFDIVPVCI